MKQMKMINSKIKNILFSSIFLITVKSYSQPPSETKVPDTSPDRNLQMELIFKKDLTVATNLSYKVYYKNKPVIPESKMDIQIDNHLWEMALATKPDNVKHWFDNQGVMYDFKSVIDKISGWINSGYYTGAAMVVAKDNIVIFKKYFGNYIPETVVYIASAGKWLAAATIAAIVDDGKLNWDDPVSKWLPEFTDVKGKATLRQLLSHTSGFPAYQPKGAHADDYQTLKESVSQIVNLPANFQPGEQFQYGGLAMQVAGRMAEVATGKDWESLFQEKIAIPLRMTSTHFTPVDPAGGHNPMLGGGARCNLDDYASFLSMISNDGIFEGKAIVSRESVKEMQADQVGKAMVNPGEFVEHVRGTKRRDIYGLGEWREEVDNLHQAVLISSPSWAGAYPWIDKNRNLYGFFLAHVNTEIAGKDHFSGIYSSPELAMMVRQIVDSLHLKGNKKISCNLL